MEASYPARRGSRRRRPRALFGSTATAAVAAKELRLWVRDPIRLTCLVIALVVGTGTGVLPRVTSGTSLLLPFAGGVSALIAAACACNLYGNDSSSLWLTVMAPGAARADVHGRQVAWLVVATPYSVAATIVLTAVSGEPNDWFWAFALLAAVLGGGAGLVPFVSVISVQPLDAAGNPTPAWSLKVHIALVVVALTALPTTLALLAGWRELAVLVGVVTGAVLALWLGHRAAVRLAMHQVAILQAVATGS
jgi:ABC-2 type transport system permease protein